MRKLTTLLALIWLVLLVTFGFTVVVPLRAAISWNGKSLDYFEALHLYQHLGGTVPPAPSHHPRSPYWQAIGELRYGDAQKVLGLIGPLAEGGDAFALEIMAAADEDIKDYAGAIQVYKRTKNVDGLLRMADYAAQAGELGLAADAYYYAWNLDPIRGVIPLGKFLQREMDDLAAAEAVYWQALEHTTLDRRRPYWLRSLAHILEKQERWGEAAKVYAQLIDETYLMYPGDQQYSRYYADMAWNYVTSDQREEAISALDRALEHFGKDPSNPYYVWFKAGQVYESAELPNEARSAYQKVLEIIPDHRGALQAMGRLVAQDGEK